MKKAARSKTAGPPCPICGKPIPSKSGVPRKTCSGECRKKRAAQKEAERYQKIKDSDEWKEGRAGYLERLASRMKQDADLKEKLLASRREATDRYVKHVDADPEQRAHRLEKKRKHWKLQSTLASGLDR